MSSPPAPEARPDDPAGRSARALLDLLRASGLTLGCAESLTGGLLSATLVSVPGASVVLRGSVVAYSAEVKVDLLGVDSALVERVGTVDAGVARAMAAGARRALGCDLAVATTGVAGPGPSEGHPAGTVHLACASPWAELSEELHLVGDREEIRRGSVLAALDLAVTVASSRPGGSVGPRHDDREEDAR